MSTEMPARRRRDRARRKRAIVAVSTAAAVALGGLGYALVHAVLAPPAAEGSTKVTGLPVPISPAAEPSSEPVTDGVAPLTGLPALHPLDHPAVTVKISNTPDAHPHRGLDAADIVFVEPITGATTRLAAIFHSNLPEQAGPVRSLRPMDAPIVGPTGGVLANTMAQGWVLDYIDREADVANLGTMRVPRGTYPLDPLRVSPNHVFAQPEALLALTDRTQPPAPYFDYAGDVAGSSAQTDGAPATTVTVGYGDPSTATWSYDKQTGRWLRAEAWSEHRLEDGTQVTADNVIVLRAARDWGFPQARADMTVLDLVNTSGRAELFTGDAVVTGHWSKVGVNDPFTFTADDGSPLLLAPGTTWVELALETMSVTISADDDGSGRAGAAQAVSPGARTADIDASTPGTTR